MIYNVPLQVIETIDKSIWGENVLIIHIIFCFIKLIY